MPMMVRVVLIVLGVLVVAVGILYLVEPVNSLPSFFPGYAAHGHIHHRSRGYLAIAVGVILLIIAAVVGRSYRSHRLDY